jgi:hypothetical protein
VPPLPLLSVLVEVVVVVVLDEELVVEFEVVVLVGAAAPPVVVMVVVVPSPPQAAIPTPDPTPRATAAAMAASRFIALLPVAYRVAQPTQARGATGCGFAGHPRPDLRRSAYELSN